MSGARRQDTVLITGAARRIGRAIALDLAAHGWGVGIHYNTSGDEAEDVCREIVKRGGRADTVQADLGVEDDVDGLIPAVNRRLGSVTCLINNASVFEHDTPATATRTSWNRHMHVNLHAPFVLTQAFVAQLPAGAEGNVINVIDQRVWNLTPQFISYTLSKSGLWAMTRTLAQGLAPSVRVNAIGPGPTLKNVMQDDREFEEEWSAVLLRRKVDVADVCAAVRFILGARSMTGQMLALDSGQHLGRQGESGDRRRAGRDSRVAGIAGTETE